MSKKNVLDPKNSVLLAAVAGLLVGIVLTGAFASTAVNTNNRRMMGMMGMGNHQMMYGNMDAGFIEQMIPHHESAIAMAKLAKEKATHQEIKDMADAIIASQQSEIDKMRAWYKEWYKKDVPTVETRGSVMMDGEAAVASLADEADFDKAFLEHMIPHHQMAVMMTNMMKLNTERDEMKKLADEIIAAQSKEIEYMKSWQKDWGYETTSSNDMMNMMHTNH